MQFRIETINPKVLVGISLRMSLSKNRTMELWKHFMPRRNEVQKRTTNDYISMQVYEDSAGELFSPTAMFEKWAVVEVSSADSVPESMLRYSLGGGQYAVFLHKGPASDYAKSMQFIFGQWLPDSGFELDQREHFEILPEGYAPMDQEAKEEIWVPVR